MSIKFTMCMTVIVVSTVIIMIVMVIVIIVVIVVIVIFMIFMVIVIFLPGGLMEGVTRLSNLFRKQPPDDRAGGTPHPAPAE